MTLRLVSTRDQVAGPNPATARAMVAGTMCYISGVTGFDEQLGQMPPSLEQQTRNALFAAHDALESAGFTLNDVVRINYAITRESDLDRILRVGNDIFDGAPPDMTYEIVWPSQRGQRVAIEMMAQRAHNNPAS